MGRKLNPAITPYEHANGDITYRVRVRVNGRNTTETFESEAAAVVFKARVMDPAIGPERAVALRSREDVASSEYVPTLGELLEQHIGELTGVQGDTKDEYRRLARRTWLPLLGTLRVDEITDVDVKAFVNALDGTIAPKSIKNAHGLLSGVMETAVRKRLAPSNPARGTRLPRTGEEETDDMRLLEHDEFEDLYYATPDWYRPLVMMLFGAGLRWSEATALQVRDVSPRAGTVRVVRAWKRKPKPDPGFVIGPPKTKRSRRTIKLPAETLSSIAPLLDRPGGDWLFTTEERRVAVRHNNFYNRIWIPTTAAAGLEPRPRIHDARHTHASWLLAQNVPIHVVSARLGHESIQTTVDTYGHLVPDLHEQAAAAASMAFASTSLRALPGS